MYFKTIYLFLLLTAAISATKKSFEGYKVYKVIPKTKQEVEILTDVQKSNIGEFWEESFDVDHKVKIMVSADNQELFVEQMKNAGIEVVEAIADLQQVIENQMKPASRNIRNQPALLSMTWDRYHTLEEIYNWLDELAEAYPDVVTIVYMGQSTQNRPIKGVRLNYRPEREQKLIGVLEGTLHAREWITPATITWVLKEFLTSSDPEIRAMAENLEWHMFPVVNPDGYVYTFTNHRMWRKNRNTAYNRTCAGNVDNDMSNGVDLNRNFGFMWMTIGASSDACSNTFAGPVPFSEVETRSIVQYVRNLSTQGRLIYYLAFHSYTQLIVIPYSHVEGGMDVLEAENYADMYEIAIRGVDRLSERFGTQYRVGVSADVMYPMSGTSFDWVKSELNVPITYLLEVRDLGDYGFLLPPEEIIPNNMEIMDFLLEMDKNTRALRYYSGSMSVISSTVMIVFSIMFFMFVH